MKQFDYQQAFGAWDRTSPAMQEAIAAWNRLYYGKGDSCQRIAYTLVGKLVRTVFSEYTAACDHPFYSRVLATLDNSRSRARWHWWAAAAASSPAPKRAALISR